MVSALLLTCALGIAGDVAAEAPQPSAADLAAYETAKAAAGRDAEAQVKLALWCESRGMAAERTAHLTRAILLDSSNAKARGLLGFVNHEGKWLRPEEVTRAIEESPERQAVFQEYLERRTKARDKSDDQYKLALWCEENGLNQQMTAHLRRVVELDPSRDGAWRRLGFKKVGKSWINPEAQAAAQAAREAQAQADKLWGPALDRIKAALSGRDAAKKAEAFEELSKIDDPRAVASVWRVFARSNEPNQRLAVEVLGRIEGAEASRALAMMAVFSPFAGVRSDASKLLTQRDPREFVALLASWIQDEIKYKAKTVRGPGLPGELLVEGKNAKLKRSYTPMSEPTPAPNDVLHVDEYGQLVGTRYLGSYVGPRTPLSRFGGVLPYLGTRDEARWAGLPQAGMFSSDPVAEVNTARTSAFQNAGATPDFSRRIANLMTPASVDLTPTTMRKDGRMVPGPEGPMPINRWNASPILEQNMRIPYGQLIEEARASALIAQQQLAQDVQRIEEHNAPIRETNDRATAILRNISGVDRGEDRDKWMEWAYDLNGYGFPQKSETPETPTYYEDVPFWVPPRDLPLYSERVVMLADIGPSCFAGGTLVRTLRGDRPIEEIQVGDQLLTQNTTTGKLEYRAVAVVFHNPPNWTYKINLGGESVNPTGIHRLWKAGHGWIMARDVKAGDRLRTIGGTVEVVSAEKDRVEPVFNLLLEGGDNYFVGSTGLLAHDNGFVEPVASPFDGVPALADLATPRKP